MEEHKIMSNQYKLFIESEELVSKIKTVANEIFEQTDHKVIFEEFIALPYFGGNIILRFNLDTNNYTLDDLDHYETIMNHIVGNEFLVDFMGTVYKNAGVDYKNLENKLLSFKIRYQDVVIPTSIHFAKIQADTQYLLRKCNLPENTEVWEIQVENPMPLLILGETNRLLKKIDNINVMETRKDACEGLMRATIFAKEKGISLGRMIKEY